MGFRTQPGFWQRVSIEVGAYCCQLLSTPLPAVTWSQPKSQSTISTCRGRKTMCCMNSKIRKPPISRRSNPFQPVPRSFPRHFPTHTQYPQMPGLGIRLYREDHGRRPTRTSVKGKPWFLGLSFTTMHIHKRKHVLEAMCLGVKLSPKENGANCWLTFPIDGYKSLLVG